MRPFLWILLLFFAGCEHEEPLSHKGRGLTYREISFEDLPGFNCDTFQDAIIATQRSCRLIMSKPSLTQVISPLSRKVTYGDWHPFCKRVLDLKEGDRARFRDLLKEFMMIYHISYGFSKDDLAQVTGYDEPLLRGSKRRHGPYQTPLYAPPKNPHALHYSRAQIVKGALVGKASPLVYVDDPVDAFFLQIQGSGRVRLDTSETIYLGYAGNTRHNYHPIGKTLVRMGASPRDVSRQSISRWLRSNPDKAERVMSTNPSYVFFKKRATTAVGAMGCVLTPKRSLAVDTSYITLGSLLWIDIEHPIKGEAHLQHLAVAQDRGGAIKGGLRADYFWGSGEKAAQCAGSMNSNGRLYVILPKC